VYLVPPGLRFKIREFEAHTSIAGRSPIMICGPSGVGKSVFIHLFRKQYQQEHGPDSKVITVNCSHFGGDLARSELFGHIRGAFTGANQDKEGWITAANGGVLILEEVGELPRETQAKLLTFIETGEFHRVGSAKVERADVQIVAATNNEKNLREDFRYRFFPFYVPPIHERRQDVLYHVADRFPQLIGTLTSWEILTLRSYHWPGNVREIERIGLLLVRKKVITEEDPHTELFEEAIKILSSQRATALLPEYNVNVRLQSSGLGSIQHQYTALKGNRAYRLYADLQKTGIAVDLLESLLNRFGIGLSIQNDTRPFANESDRSLHLNVTFDDRLQVRVCNEVRQFKAAYRGLQTFCSLFWQDEREDVNLLEPSETTFTTNFLPAKFIKHTKVNASLAESIYGYVNRQRKHQDGPEQTDIWSMSRDELLRFYYDGLLQQTAGNQAKAAKKAGIRYATFRDHLKKYVG